MSFTPLLGIAFSVWLVSRPDLATWLRFITWCVIGAIIYGLYGYRHAKLGHVEVVQTDDG